jgi:hypothetical protein
VLSLHHEFPANSWPWLGTAEYGGGHEHLNSETIARNSEFLASVKVGCDLRTVDDVFARQASDVRARSANVFTIDHRDTLSLSRSDCGASTATQDYEIEVLCLFLIQ